MLTLHAATSALSTPSRGLNERAMPRRAALQGLGAGLVGANLPPLAAATAAAPTTAPPLAAATAAAPKTAAAAPASLVLPPIGIGAWAWGDSLFWGYDKKNDNELRETFEYVANSKYAFFDTAEIYGLGRSETLLGDFEKASGQHVAIASKFAALPWKTKPADVVKACKGSLQRMGRDSMELYQIHFPNAWANAAYWDGIADCYDRGLVKAVGVSNYGVDAVTAASEALAARGVPLYSNQIQYSLLHPFANQNGLKQRCDELGVKVLAYSPIGLGLLSGKYSRDSLPSGPRAQLGKAFFEQGEAADTLVAAVRRTADKHGGTPAQVAINWCVAKGALPIPGARNLQQAQQNLGALAWKLDAEDVAALDAASAAIRRLDGGNSPFPERDIGTGLRMFDS